MDERNIQLSQMQAGFELPELDGIGLGDWAPVGTDRVAWSASFRENGRFKSACFIQELSGKLVKKLTSPGGTGGPIVTDAHIIFGGGANGATPAVYARDTFKKVGGLKGHKSHLGGLVQLGDGCVTIGGKNSTPFDDTVRVWDAATVTETAKAKLSGRPQTVVAHGSRVFVQTWDYPDETRLYALDDNGQEIWSRDNGKKTGILSLSSDGQTVAWLDGETLTFLNPDGEPQRSCSLQGTGTFRMASSWGAPAFSPDDRFLFLTPEYEDVTHGTIVIDVERCEPVLQLHGVVRPRPFGADYGAWVGAGRNPSHFAILPAALIEP